ncbi:tRNA(Ile)-lysidine synthase [Lutibacter agarilyticus]|uniref:tRNA(Ile)-lysidine synthase n=1 Tax=Lutibacter agarilyticus TaxID=1109740 RepID=A0A238Z8T9_9FLAO|nr:tRNA lysidine(34) synthetase TilS [Lutibacter agarilyticus]SNR79263.1 tRNA(Ile)-lysidine synthase [Lutibacter agarilyticus]
MQTAFEEHLNKNLPFLKGKKLLVAISGGIDSVVLTHLLHKLNFNISLAHCNFMLRGKESNKDEQFVKELGEKLAAPTYTIQFNTKTYAEENGLSTQMAARELRYNWFQELSKQHNLDYIITAHQKDDVIETFLINLTRGTGLNGLTGIPEVNKNVVRPLLPFNRNQILVHATKRKLQWREDSTNSSIKYVRNKIRHKVVPFLKELNPSLLETFSNTLENLKGSQQIINDRINEIKEKAVSVTDEAIHFEISELKKLSNPKVYLYELLQDYGFTEWDDITNLLDSQTGKQVFSSTHRLLKNRETLILSEINDTEQIVLFEVPENTSKIKKPIKLKFKKVDIPFDTKNHETKVFGELILDKPGTVSIDYDQLEFPLTIRKWQKGDAFYPIGLNGKKKLSKFFKDEKLSLLEKENTWLLCSKGQIVWVIGKRLDNRFKVSKTTSAILKIKL